MKKIICLCSIIFLLSIKLFGQSITINECYKLATENYPLNKQRALLSQVKDKGVQNAINGYFPKINFLSQATYQSEVPHISLQIPGIEIPSPDKFQYKAVGEVNQVIYDGGIISNQKKLIESNSRFKEKEIEVEIYKIKGIITDIYFATLLLQSKNELLELSKNDLNLLIKKVKSQVENGYVLKSNLSILKAELLKIEQLQLEINSEINSNISAISELTGENINKDIKLIIPEKIQFSEEIDRLELELFAEKNKALEAQKGMVLAGNLPKIFAFFQGGYGKPTPNLFNENAGWFYLTGINLTIPITGFYNQSNDFEIVNINKLSNEVMKETFLFNTKLELVRQKESISKYQLLLEKDDEIIELRESIKQAAAAQLQNGVINSNDFIKELNAQETAKLNKVEHNLQLIYLQYKNKISTGK